VAPVALGPRARRAAGRLLRGAARRLDPPPPAPRPPAPERRPEPTPPLPTPEELAFPPVHDRAEAMFRALRDHAHLEDRESRLHELIEYFGWEVGHRARYAAHWFYQDDPREHRYVEALGVGGSAHRILHQYSLFNRMDPERPDFFWVYDGALRRLEELGGPGRVSVLDFGTGLGQIGLSLCAAGYRTVMSDREPDFLAFVRWRTANHRLEPVLHQAPADDTFYDTAADGHDYGLVVEWSTFEHVHEPVAALEKVTGGLLPGGMFVTTTFKKDWTPELVEHYRRDSASDGVGTPYLDPAVDAWLDERFDVLSPPKTLAKVLVRR
jgi:SAM-dependent methyltransferase